MFEGLASGSTPAGVIFPSLPDPVTRLRGVVDQRTIQSPSFPPTTSFSPHNVDKWLIGIRITCGMIETNPHFCRAM